MSDTTTHLGLPYLLAAQAQKHVTHNEALRLLDAMVQLSVLDRTRTAPPASPADGDRHLVAAGATGVWSGWDLNIAYRIDGAWIRLVPRVGWQVWVADEGVPLVWTGSAWQDVAERPLQVPRIGVNAASDTTDRLAVNSPGVLLNHAGAGIEATVNKAAAGNDAAFAFKTGFSARARIGLLGNDDFSFKVSPDGSAFFDAIRIDRASGRVDLPQPTVLPGLAAAPSPPPSGKASVYARSRAGAPWIDVMRPSGRDFPLQPHFGVNRIASWSPSTGTTITTEGLPITSVGTVSHPTLAATNLAASMRRWRLTSAAAADSVADQRSAGWACWRGNAAGLGGWTFVTRISLTTLQATGMGFFGLYGSTAALATTLTLAAAVNCIGIGFQRGTRPLADGQQRRDRCADPDRHGCEFRHRHRRRADPVHRCPAERQFRLGPCGRRGLRRRFRAGNHRRPARRDAVPVAAAVPEHRRNSRRRSPATAPGSTWRRTSDATPRNRTGLGDPPFPGQRLTRWLSQALDVAESGRAPAGVTDIRPPNPSLARYPSGCEARPQISARDRAPRNAPSAVNR
jgi:hypothetical protein